MVEEMGGSGVIGVDVKNSFRIFSSQSDDLHSVFYDYLRRICKLTREVMLNTLLSINNYYYRRGGAESVFFEHNRMFEEMGWRAVPFAMQHANNQPSPWEEYFVDEIEYGEKYSLINKISAAQKIIYSFEARKKLLALIRLVKPVVAHAHNVYHHLSPSVFGLLKQNGVPTVMTLHDLKIACPAYKMLAQDGVCERCAGGRIWNVAVHRCIKESRLLSTLVLLETAVHKVLGCYARDVDRFAVPSRFYIEKFVSWGWPREKFTLVPNFVDAEELVPTACLPGTAFIYAGRLAPEKGLVTFIRAVALAGVEGWVVGTGPDTVALRALGSSSGAKVRFFGHCNAIELYQLIGRARALVLPSEWYENAPLSVMEASALGRPVIGADIGGIPELIRDGASGSLFPSGDAQALAHVLARYAAMPASQVRDMGQCGRALMIEQYSAGAYRRRVLGLYGELGVAR